MESNACVFKITVFLPVGFGPVLGGTLDLGAGGSGSWFK